MARTKPTARYRHTRDKRDSARYHRSKAAAAPREPGSHSSAIYLDQIAIYESAARRLLEQGDCDAAALAYDKLLHAQAELKIALKREGGNGTLLPVEQL